MPCALGRVVMEVPVLFLRPLPRRPRLRRAANLAVSCPSRLPRHLRPAPLLLPGKRRQNEYYSRIWNPGIGINASSFLKGIKTDVFKEIATHLEKQKVSPRGVLRTWTAVKSRLTAMLKKYYTALRKKQQTGWGADRGEKTIKGAQLDLSLLSSLSIELSEM